MKKIFNLQFFKITTPASPITINFSHATIAKKALFSFSSELENHSFSRGEKENRRKYKEMPSGLYAATYIWERILRKLMEKRRKTNSYEFPITWNKSYFYCSPVLYGAEKFHFSPKLSSCDCRILSFLYLSSLTKIFPPS